MSKSILKDSSGFKKGSYKLGPVIKIDGNMVQTYMTGDVQRLPCNKHLNNLIHFESSDIYQNVRILDLNNLCFISQMNKDVEETRIWLYQRIGYSVCGYAEVFPNAKIENPLWNKKD